MALGQYTIKLSAKWSGKSVQVQYPVDVYEIQHVTGQIKEGSLPDYIASVKTYDRGKLNVVSLAELAHLLAEGGDAKAAIEAGREYVGRYAGGPPQALRRMRRLMADCALQLGEGRLDEAIANYRDSLDADTPAPEKLAVLARLIRLVGIDRGLPDKSRPLAAEASDVWKAARRDDPTMAAYRDCLMATGDVYLWHAQLPEAREQYRQAEALDPVAIPSQVRAAKVGSYPEVIREFIASGDYGAALDIVGRWEHTFPTETLTGHPLFWRGKLLALRDNIAKRRATSPDPSGWPSAPVLRARPVGCWPNRSMRLGDRDQSRRELAKLIAAGFDDEFARKAWQKMAAGYSTLLPKQGETMKHHADRPTHTRKLGSLLAGRRGNGCHAHARRGLGTQHFRSRNWVVCCLPSFSPASASLPRP